MTSVTPPAASNGVANGAAGGGGVGMVVALKTLRSKSASGTTLSKEDVSRRCTHTSHTRTPTQTLHYVMLKHHACDAQ